MSELYLSWKDNLLIYDCLKVIINNKDLVPNFEEERARNIAEKIARRANKRMAGYTTIQIKEVELCQWN